MKIKNKQLPQGATITLIVGFLLLSLTSCSDDDPYHYNDIVQNCEFNPIDSVDFTIGDTNCVKIGETELKASLQEITGASCFPDCELCVFNSFIRFHFLFSIEETHHEIVLDASAGCGTSGYYKDTLFLGNTLQIANYYPNPTDTFSFLTTPSDQFNVFIKSSN